MVLYPLAYASTQEDTSIALNGHTCPVTLVGRVLVLAGKLVAAGADAGACTCAGAGAGAGAAATTGAPGALARALAYAVILEQIVMAINLYAFLVQRTCTYKCIFTFKLINKIEIYSNNFPN